MHAEDNTLIDLFAGAGGMSEGARLAGLRVVAAVNHWPRAVETHTIAHPSAKHYCEDAAGLNPHKLPKARYFSAAPSCTGHTKARGKEQPHHDAARATAWCVVRVAEAHDELEAVVIENVPEMLKWKLYPAWHHAMSLLGFRLTEHLFDAADADTPQRRKRLILVGVRDRAAVTIPTPSRPHIAAGTVIDTDTATGRWARWDTYVTRSQDRIRAARIVQGSGPFLVPYYKSLSSYKGRSLALPIGTLTTHDRYVLVNGDLARVLTLREQLALQGFREDYPLTGTRGEGVKQVGNATPPPLARYVFSHLRAQIEGLSRPS